METFPIIKAHMSHTHSHIPDSIQFNSMKKWSMCHLFNLKMHLSFFLWNLSQIYTKKNGTNHIPYRETDTNAKQFDACLRFQHILWMCVMIFAKWQSTILLCIDSNDDADDDNFFPVAEKITKLLLQD